MGSKSSKTSNEKEVKLKPQVWGFNTYQKNNNYDESYSTSQNTQSETNNTIKSSSKKTIEKKYPFKFEWKGNGKSVLLAGNFLDNWTNTEVLVKNNDTGAFELLLYLPKGKHQFKFIVDNKWICSNQYPTMADERGIIILTDSDHAGFMIRNHLLSAIPKEKITNVYIPDVFGKEKRKTQASKEGKLGVEGMSKETLLEAFSKANINCEINNNPNPITSYDLFELGLSGTPNAKQNKKKLLKELELPEFLSTSSLLSYLNNNYSKDEIFKMIKPEN